MLLLIWKGSVLRSIKTEGSFENIFLKEPLALYFNGPTSVFISSTVIVSFAIETLYSNPPLYGKLGLLNTAFPNPVSEEYFRTPSALNPSTKLPEKLESMDTQVSPEFFFKTFFK